MVSVIRLEVIAVVNMDIGTKTVLKVTLSILCHIYFEQICNSGGGGDLFLIVTLYTFLKITMQFIKIRHVFALKKMKVEIHFGKF